MGSNKLLIASVIDPGHWYLFDEQDRCISHEKFALAGREFDLFLETLEQFLKSNSISIQDLKTIYLVTGPASFTGGRIMTLTLGSLALVYPKLQLVGITLFEYWEMAGNNFPMAIEANRQELVIQRGSKFEMELISKSDAQDISFKTWYTRTGNLSKSENLIQFHEEISILPIFLTRKAPTRILHPIYIKKPNITLSPTSYDTSRPTHQ